jgi:predicted nucleic acid-binding protein
MTNPKSRRYWESSIFVALVKGERGRVDEPSKILADAAKGEVEIVTSAWTLAEVVKRPQEPLLSEDVERKIIDFFENEYIVVINLDRKVAEQARSISRQHGVKPKDAVHVATATVGKVEMLETWDDGLTRLDGKIGDPPLVIRHPKWEGQPPLPGI